MLEVSGLIDWRDRGSTARQAQRRAQGRKQASQGDQPELLWVTTKICKGRRETDGSGKGMGIECKEVAAGKEFLVESCPQLAPAPGARTG